MSTIPSLHVHDYADKDTQHAEAPFTFMSPCGISDSLLAELLNHAKSVPTTSALPSLPPSNKTVADYEALAAVPSFGAGILEAIVRMSSAMRRQNADLRAVQLQAMAQQMESQAASLHNKARTMLYSGVAAGILSIAAGVSGGILSMVAVSNAHGPEAKSAEYLQSFNNMITSINTTGGGGSSLSQSIGQSNATLFDEVVKRSEAEVERTRSRMEYLKSVEESMRELIAKAISVQDAIQQNTNQTRTKILG